MRQLEKTYDAGAIEERIYQAWESSGGFHMEPDKSKTPYCIVMPPPNITGQLHIGHALDNTLQDILTRFARMRGYCTLWLPGTDHASIATEVKLVDQLAEEGLTKADVGREEFLRRAWRWKEKYGGRIVKQFRKMGTSCDWQRERFTMDEGCNRAVVETFVKLYRKGLIYRGNRIINWCPDCRTALSDAEVEYGEQAGHLWHIRYYTPDGKDHVTVATTRPETMLGDTAVAVHPKDERYSRLVGKTVILPLMEREIPVIADEYVEMDFGTGVVKITPAHDPNDFEVGARHNLPVLRVMDDDGVINELGGKYAGQDRYEARKNIVADLEKLGLLEKVEDYKHNVGSCYRCSTTVEPIVSRQWFVSMAPLAKSAIEAVTSGDIRFVPERFAKTYLNWMENIRDWCISRQLWWGHRIPAYYCGECGEITVDEKAPEACPKCGSTDIKQDEDVLDTWFSSGLWPFSTMGWPDKTADLDYFYPTTVLVTGYDIIFFWVARMIVFGLENMGRKPFSDVFIHGIVRDAQGRKMSKSLGNGVDPIEVIEKYGADALRFSLTVGTSPGNDMRFSWEKAEAARNFANKIWNAARFCLMNEIEPADLAGLELDIADKWALHRLNGIIADITSHMEKYELGLSSQKLYDFVWSEFCDWYVEMAKERLYGGDEAAKKTVRAVLFYLLENILKLLHPFMPFITEEIYGHMRDGMIMLSEWPKADAALEFAKEADDMQAVMDVIREIRNIRTEMNVPPSVKSPVYIVAAKPERFERAKGYISRLAYASEVYAQESRGGVPENAVSGLTPEAEVFMPMEGIIDVGKEIGKLEKEAEGIVREIERAKGKLANEGFVRKAPEAVVAEERAKLVRYEEMLEKTQTRLATLKRMKGK